MDQFDAFQTVVDIGAYGPDEFLKLLDWEERGIKFTQPISLVIVGPCSEGYGSLESGSGILDSFYDLFAGRKEDWHEGGAETYFDQYVGAVKEGNILLISNCCGCYGENVVGAFQARYPDIKLILPKYLRDFGNHADVLTVLKELIRLEYIQ